MDQDLLNPTYESELQKHKLKRLVQAPNSYFMYVRCSSCTNVSTIYSHAQTVIHCDGCNTILCKPTGGKAKITIGCSFKVKA